MSVSVSRRPKPNAKKPVKDLKCKPYFKLIKRQQAPRTASGVGPWSVPDLCKAYDWPTNQAGGGVIAIVELGGGWVQSDMDAYFQSIGQPMPQITDVSVDGTQNSPNLSIGKSVDADLEVALDIQVAAASYFVATGKPAVIRVYWAGEIAPAVRAAMADGCDVCSISWGSDEAYWGSSALDMESAAQAATAAGMVVFGAAGDNDSSDGGLSPANVDAPSSCPHVIGCGGTNKTPTDETVWNQSPGQTHGEGTGGGYSRVFPAPPWQTGAPAGPGGRMVPDLTADGDPNTGYLIVVHGAQQQEGGTSAVAPLIAGLFASFGTKLGFVTPKLWANQNCFNDITVGNNGFYAAGPGPDPCSGIGSPIGTKLAALLGAPVSTPAGSHAATPATIPAGWSGMITYTYKDGSLVNTALVAANR
jgi:kumamolisin